MAGRNSEDAGALQQALEHLAGTDRHMADAIAEIGAPPPRFRPAGFATLMHVIIAQQVSVASARAISGRLTERLSKITPDGFIALTDADLRAVGFSRQKTVYGRDLAAAFLDGRVALPKLRRMADEEGHCRALFGEGDRALVGRGVPAVQPEAAGRDAGPGPGPDGSAQRLKGLRTRPDPKKLLKIAEPWRPFRSYGARMLWHYYRNGKGGIGGQPL